MEERTPYFNKETSILEFPIQVWVKCQQICDVPCLKLTTFAIVTDPSNIFLKHPCIFEGPDVKPSNLVNLGQCSVYESVYTDIEVINNSHVLQHFYFPDLPEVCVILCCL